MATPMTTAIADGEDTDEMQRLLLALREALTDSMVERLAVTAGVAMEVVDRLNDEDTRDAVHTIIDRVTEFHRIGALDTLFETVLLMHAMRSAATDSIVERLFVFAEQMANTLGSEAMTALADDVLNSLDTAASETAKTPATGGLFSTLSMISKPETQQTLQFLLKFGDALRRSNHASGDA